MDEDGTGAGMNLKRTIYSIPREEEKNVREL